MTPLRRNTRHRVVPHPACTYVRRRGRVFCRLRWPVCDFCGRTVYCRSVTVLSAPPDDFALVACGLCALVPADELLEIYLDTHLAYVRSIEDATRDLKALLAMMQES